MESIAVLFVHLIIFVLIFSIAYWMINLIVSAVPAVPPFAGSVNLIRALLFCLLGILAISFLCGEAGWWGTWGWGYHPVGYKH